MILKKNDVRELKITAMSSEGSGIGRTDENIVVFVPGSAVGDKLSVKILKVKKNIAYGKIEKIIEPSSDRIKPDCDVYDKCGGCVYRHISYEAELAIKHRKVVDAIQRIGKLDPSLIGDILSANKGYGYRNKAQIPVSIDNDIVQMGFYSKHSHRINTCLDCRLSPDIFNDISKEVYSFLNEHKELPYNETLKEGYIRHLYLRIGEKTGEVMVCFVVNGNDFPYRDAIVGKLIKRFNNIRSIILNINKEDTNVILGKRNIVLYGEDHITDMLCGLKFNLSPNSFYQVNHDGAEILYSKAKEFASPDKDDVLLDLYCGTGTIGLSMAGSCKKVVGIEIVEDAVKNADNNKRINNISNAEFICADALTYDFSNINPDIIVVDPPRKGLGPILIDLMMNIYPKRIVYVSCDPATLARDLAIINSTDKYYIKNIVPVDMFERTNHVETLVLMSRKSE